MERVYLTSRDDERTAFRIVNTFLASLKGDGLSPPYTIGLFPKRSLGVWWVMAGRSDGQPVDRKLIARKFAQFEMRASNRI